MTEVRAYHPEMKEFLTIESCYKMEPSKIKKDGVMKIWKEKEEEISSNLIEQGYEILLAKSQLISKRRYKRRTAKALMKLSGTKK